MLQCPFCHSPEQDRVVAQDGDGRQVVLLMFDCPFFLRVEPAKLASEDEGQAFLDNWRVEHGEDWLEGIGPLLRDRELKNIRRLENGGPSSKTRR